MSLDLRRFLVHDWRLLEVENDLSVRLVREWEARFGYVPPLANDAVSGWHFAIPHGRAFVVARPKCAQLPRHLRGQVYTLLRAKHRIEFIRVATPEETPDLRAAARVPEPSDLDQVEQFPALERECREPVLVEFQFAPGHFVSTEDESNPVWSPTHHIEQALTFESAAEAEAWIAAARMRNQLAPRFLAAVRAAADQREAGRMDDGMI